MRPYVKTSLIICLLAAGLLVFVLAPEDFLSDRGADITQVSSDPPTNPQQREEWWSMVNGTPPTRDQLARAQRVIERQLRVRDQGRYRDAGINAWDDLGPKNIGGRTRAVALNPDNSAEIYVGAVAGGIWRSQNSGVNWSEVTPTTMAYPITHIAIDPTNSNVIYATTGEYSGSAILPGVGVLKSTNGGDDWSVLPPPDTNFLWLGKVIINPLDPDILYVVGSTADSSQANAPNVPGANPSNDRRAVFRSNDAGQTWTQLLGGGVIPNHIWDIEINPNDTSELIIGTRYQALISNNSGATWSSLIGSSPLITTVANFNGRRCEVAYCGGTPSTIYVLRYLLGTGMSSGTTRSELWQSTDGGSNWAMLTSTAGDGTTDAGTNILGGQGIYDNTLWVDPTNCSRAIMGGINLWKWSGSTLTRISQWSDDIDGNDATGGNNSVHADQHIIVPHPGYNGNDTTTVFIGNDGGLYFSSSIWTATQNSGWQAMNTEMNITQLYGIDVSLTGDTLIAGSQDNSYFVDRTGNASDLHWGVYSTGDGAHSAIKKSDPEVMYTSVQNARVFKSTDGGDSFCRLITLDGSQGGLQCNNFTWTNDNPLFIAPLEMDPNDDNSIYIAATQLFATFDEGNSWSLIRNPLPSGSRVSTIEIARGDGNTIWVGYANGTVSLTTDGGTNWTNVNNNGSGIASNYITDIAINPNDHNEVMVTVAGGFNQTNVYYSNDAGQSWDNRSPDFDLLVYTVTWHPSEPDWAYIGTALGIFATEDGGQNWSITPLQNASEGPVQTPIVELVWQGDGSVAHPHYLVAATHGRGAWRSSFPIRSKYYVDKGCSPCGSGSLAAPYATFLEALEAAGNGAEIIFLSGGTYNEISSSEAVEKRLKITIDASSSAVIIE